MTARIARPVKTFGRIRQGLLVLWAGAAIGVAFLATPAKFLAPSLSLPVALDVGRHTFALYNRAELGLLALLLAIGMASRAPRRWYLALTVPGVIVILQAAWLIPMLDHRVAMILAGGRPLPSSNLHAAYIAAELVKIVALVGFGFAQPGPVRSKIFAAKSPPPSGGEGNGVYRVPRGWRSMPQAWRPREPAGEGAAAMESGQD